MTLRGTRTERLEQEHKYPTQSILLAVEEKRLQLGNRDDKCVAGYNLLYLRGNLL